MGSRTWIKIYCDKWLNGTIRGETLEVRAVWVDLLVLAGSGKYGDSGEIKITDTVGLLNQQLADLLQISTRKWKIISKRLQETDRICISENNVIAIINWAKYQSEFDRQKSHREPAFVELRDDIKQRDGHTCQLCNKHERELRVPLCIHHINNDPSDNRGENLITLCMSCHSHLLKKAVHPTKEDERKSQEAYFNKIVQQKSSTISATGDRDRDKRLEIIDKEIRDTPLNPPVSQSLSTKEVIAAYQENILLGDTVNEEMEYELSAACARYSQTWVMDAIKEAMAQNQPFWRYIVGILKNWQKEGKKTG